MQTSTKCARVWAINHYDFIQNAFSKLGEFGFDVFPSLVVDLLHEFELGVWKSLFIHLIRILEAEDRLSTGRSSKVDELDRRLVILSCRFCCLASDIHLLGTVICLDLLSALLESSVPTHQNRNGLVPGTTKTCFR